MLQISNMDDGKSEWNMNETHIIIPMIDGDVTNKESEKILSSTLTLNALEGGDQTILTNALEHSLVIGLDKNLFEAPNCKSDLVIIQNSDLKLLSCNSDSKTPVTYTLSYVDQDKSEILWQTPIPRDRICVSDKAILEVRDVLNYECIHELEKSEQQINLDSIDSDIASQVAKTGILAEDAMCDPKREAQYINYYPASQTTEGDPILPHLDSAKFIDNVQVVENKKLFNNNHPSESVVVSSTYKLVKDSEKNILSVTEPVMEINEAVPIKLFKNMKHKTEKKTVFKRNKDTKDEKPEGKLKIGGVSNFLPEKSLPLKKKAKMKRTVLSISSENRTSLLKPDVIAVNHTNMKFPAEKKTKKLPVTNLQDDQDPCNTHSYEPSAGRGTKRKKATKIKTNPQKVQKSIQETVVEDEKSKNLAWISSGEDTAIKINFCTFDRSKFSNIYDLVECLRKCRLINATVWQTLNSGLKEMKVDILKEMNAKINETFSQEGTHYSPQLKAFALVLYFKQPAAFNHLSQVYKTGWPSLNVIKEWKRRMNSQQRPDFIRAERGTDNSNS